MQLFYYPKLTVKDIETWPRPLSAIINVADEPCLLFETLPVPYYWFPINELGRWGYMPFFGALKVVAKHKNKGEIIIHCIGGACRSPMVMFTILKAYDWTTEQIAGAFPLFSDIECEFNNFIQQERIPRDLIPFLQASLVYPNKSVVELLYTIGSPDFCEAKLNH